MRQVVLDTETTGLEPELGHRVIEIGAVELIDRRLTGNNYHVYLNPQREIDEGAMEVHGITPEFLADKPLFEEVANEFLEYVEGAELIIHNAPFDLGFLDYEFSMLGRGSKPFSKGIGLIDTLEMARDLHPGQRNNLDALCKRYEVDNTSRTLHGALLDSEILADVYLAMTGGQVDLGLSVRSAATDDSHLGEEFATERPALRVIRATAEELVAHQARLQAIKENTGQCLWLEQEQDKESA